jgi:hypothetical protein
LAIAEPTTTRTPFSEPDRHDYFSQSLPHNDLCRASLGDWMHYIVLSPAAAWEGARVFAARPAQRKSIADLELGRRRGEFDRPRIILADRRYLVARIRALGIGTQMENDVEARPY